MKRVKFHKFLLEILQKITDLAELFQFFSKKLLEFSEFSKNDRIGLLFLFRISVGTLGQNTID